jgi:two-component system nitrate/nitrite response regulator NarL
VTATKLTLVHKRSLQTDHPSSSFAATVLTALICENSLVRSGLKHILQGTSFLIVDADTGQGAQSVLEPALVIVEISWETGRVVENVEQVRERFPQARIVALSDQCDLNLVQLGCAAGLDGFCLTTNAPDVLIKSLELVMLGEKVLPSAVLRAVIDSIAQGHKDDDAARVRLLDLKDSTLSPREAQILDCLREGAPNKVIANKLDVSEATVKVHVKAILRKIGASNRTQAAMWAAERLSSQGGSDAKV